VRLLGQAALATGAVAVPLALVLLGLWCCGYPAAEVLAVGLHGALGGLVRIALSLEEATPLLLTGLAAAVAFRAGVFNIGAEGQYLVGAVALVAVTTRGAWLLSWAGTAAAMVAALLIAALAGALWALPCTLLVRRRAVPVVLSSILLNFVALALVGALVEGPLHDPATSAPQTALIADALHLPVLVAGSKLHLGALIALALALVLWLVERSSVFGFELRACGLNPLGAQLMGMPVAARQAEAMALSGALAGLAGGLQLLGVTYFMTSDTASYGYAGVAVALLGRLHPLGVTAAALFFGMLDTASRNLEKHLAIPHDLGDLLKGLILLAVLVSMVIAERWRRRSLAVPAAPASDGTGAAGSGHA
jgi:simple sugar transport system permease protein